jgi:hypothetical protein
MKVIKIIEVLNKIIPGTFESSRKYFIFNTIYDVYTYLDKNYPYLRKNSY